MNQGIKGYKLTSVIRYLCVATALSVLLAGCSSESRKTVNISLIITANGEAVDQALVSVAGKAAGRSDAAGKFKYTLKVEPDSEIDVAVSKEKQGYGSEPWVKAIPINKENSQSYQLDVALNFKPYITFTVTGDDKPLVGVPINMGKQQIGTTSEIGKFRYYYSKELKRATFSAKQRGYARWRKSFKSIVPGEQIQVALRRSFILDITARTDRDGSPGRVPNLNVYLNDKKVGKTNRWGKFKLVRKARPGKTASLRIESDGYVPAWREEILLEDEVIVDRFFFDTRIRPIRVGIMPFATNTAGLNLGAAPVKAGESVAAYLSKLNAFTIMQAHKFDEAVKKSRLSPKKIRKSGWYRTPLNRKLDAIVIGSVAKEDSGYYLIEIKFYNRRGQLLYGQIERARNLAKIDRSCKTLVKQVAKNFPFSGRILAKNHDGLKTNLGSSPYNLGRGEIFHVYRPNVKNNKIRSYVEVGSIRLGSVSRGSSTAQVQYTKKGEAIQAGDKIIRRTADMGTAERPFVISTTTSLGGASVPVAAVNVYAKTGWFGKMQWLGSTDESGKTVLKLRDGKTYALYLYRHGYAQISDKISVRGSKTSKEYTLRSYHSIFKVDTNPKGAWVEIDDEKIGTTPILTGKPVPLGFRRVRLDVGGDYRPWDEIVEFNGKEKDMTGQDIIRLHKDYMRLGEKAEKKNDIEAAINAYRSTRPEHPDFAEAHSRLGQIYLDNKSDYDAAIREYEQVFEIPEIKNLIYKQYAINYTNLGYAYYRKAAKLLKRDKKTAVADFGKAVKSLSKARENTRFFPAQAYDVAVHDTYYYLAMSYHKLYEITRNRSVQHEAETAWRNYLDFFPKKLENYSQYKNQKENARKYFNLLRRKG